MEEGAFKRAVREFCKTENKVGVLKNHVILETLYFFKNHYSIAMPVHCIIRKLLNQIINEEANG